jgi:hypothetical protein
MLLLEVLLKAPPLKEGAGGEGGQLQSGVLPQDFVVVGPTRECTWSGSAA